jgi:ATP/maltotriose-dependent transcriptional regulator MalT
MVIVAAAVGRENGSFAAVLYGFALIAHARGHLDESRRLFLDLKDMYERVIGPTTTYYALGLQSLARVELQRGDVAAARELLRTAVAVHIAAGGDSSKYTQAARAELEERGGGE